MLATMTELSLIFGLKIDFFNRSSLWKEKWDRLIEKQRSSSMSFRSLGLKGTGMNRTFINGGLREITTIFPLRLKLKVFATLSGLIIPISLQPYLIDLRYFELIFLLDQIVWIIKGLHHQDVKLKRCRK